MSASSKPVSDRREFLAHMATAAVVIAGTACAAPLASASGQAAGPAGHAPGAAPFDDSWTRRVASAKRRAVFDSPGIDDGLALQHATFFMQGYKEMFGADEGDIVPVVVLRHQGTSIAFNDAIWEKYAIGERAKLKDPLTGKDALRNPFLHVDKDDKQALVPTAASLEGLRASGAVLLACNKAAMHFAGEMATKFKRDVEEVRADLRNGLAPGVLLQPSGIYAVHRAQEVGCTFLKST